MNCSRVIALLGVAVVTVLSSGRLASPETQRTGAPTLTYRVVRSYPHDRQAYTQGLVFHEDALYEGTGLNGQSSIRKVRLETGEVLQIRPLDEKYFGAPDTASWRRPRMNENPCAPRRPHREASAPE